MGKTIGSPAPRGRAGRDSGSTGGTILVVDDAQVVSEIIADLLAEEGYSVVQAGNGREALEALFAGLRPDIILLDLIMPVMDGWQFLGERSKNPALRAIPVLVISATAEVAEIPGTGGFIRKPMKLDRLLEAVERECRRDLEGRR